MANIRNLSRAEIEELLPHRGHALFLRNAAVEGWHVKAEAEWDVSHPHLAGHFPGLPIVPGLFLIEAAAQSVGVVLGNLPGAATGTSDRRELAVLAGVKESLLHNMVRPSQIVRFQVDVEPILDGKYFAAFGAAQDGDGNKVLTVHLNVALVQLDDIRGG